MTQISGPLHHLGIWFQCTCWSSSCHKLCKRFAYSVAVFLPLFSANHLDFNLVDLCCISALEWVCRTATQISLSSGRNMKVSLISGFMEFHSHNMIMESTSSHKSKLGSPFFGPVPVMWLNFLFSFKYVRTN